jgi:hypothetical protein
MNCKFCNAEIDENHKFCPFCGEETPAVLNAEKSQKKVWPIVLGIVGAVAGLAALAIALLLALGVDFKAFLPRENNILAKDTYIVSDNKSVKKEDVVVATMGDKELTNDQLQIYYRMQVMEFLSYYGSYLSQLGVDTNKPLSEQECYYNVEQNWEQFFVEKAIETWQNYQAVGLMAEEDGFEMGEDYFY